VLDENEPVSKKNFGNGVLKPQKGIKIGKNKHQLSRGDNIAVIEKQIRRDLGTKRRGCKSKS